MMKLFFKSAPLQLAPMTRFRTREEVSEWWAQTEAQYHDTRELLQGFIVHPGPSPEETRGPGVHAMQSGFHTFSPLADHLRGDPLKRRQALIPDIRKYLHDNGVTDTERQDTFIDINPPFSHFNVDTPRILVDKEAADVHEKMARATRQSGFGRNNPGYEFGNSAELASHDFGDIRYFVHPISGAPIPLMHVRRAFFVDRAPDDDANSSNLVVDAGLHLRIKGSFRLGVHPSYGYLGTTHTHPVLGHVTPSKSDMNVHDLAAPYGYSQIIRPGMNMEAFNRQVIARYGSADEARRQWAGDEKNMSAEYQRFVQNAQTLSRHGAASALQGHAPGNDRTGMSLTHDARLFMARHPSRPLQWPGDPGTDRGGRWPDPITTASPRLDWRSFMADGTMPSSSAALNYALEEDFTAIHPHHVIYLGGRRPNAHNIYHPFDQARHGGKVIMSRSAFHAALGTPQLQRSGHDDTYSSLMSALSVLRQPRRPASTSPQPSEDMPHGA